MSIDDPKQNITGLKDEYAKARKKAADAANAAKAKAENIAKQVIDAASDVAENVKKKAEEEFQKIKDDLISELIPLENKMDLMIGKQIKKISDAMPLEFKKELREKALKTQKDFEPLLEAIQKASKNIKPVDTLKFFSDISKNESIGSSKNSVIDEFSKRCSSVMEVTKDFLGNQMHSVIISLEADASVIAGLSTTVPVPLVPGMMAFSILPNADVRFYKEFVFLEKSNVSMDAVLGIGLSVNKPKDVPGWFFSVYIEGGEVVTGGRIVYFSLPWGMSDPSPDNNDKKFTFDISKVHYIGCSTVLGVGTGVALADIGIGIGVTRPLLVYMLGRKIITGEWW